MATDNCTITGVAAPNAPDVAGKITYPAATAVSVRATFTRPRTFQRAQLLQLHKHLAGILFVLKRNLPAGVTIENGHRLTIELDESDTMTLVASDVADQVKGSLSHFECVMEDRK